MMAKQTGGSALERHPKLALAGINLAIVLALLAVAEIVARVMISYNPQYYTSLDTTDRELRYPYGIIKINTLGHPDDEFLLDDPRPRVAYVGDSVTYGVGAGYGYRFSDLLEARYPAYQHMTLASIGSGFRDTKRMDDMVDQAKELGIDLLLYFYNLNDTLPGREANQPGASQPPKSTTASVLKFFRNNTNSLRKNSYFFNWLRFRARIFLIQIGIEYHGETAYELFPRENAATLRDTAGRISYLAERLEAAGIAFGLVILPYEMQISADAERAYRAYDINWEDGFIERSTQRLLRDYLAPEIMAYDAYDAFVTAPGDRENIAVGELFVYDEGDSLDWNHPNRAGHKLLADYLARVDVLAPLAAKAGAKAQE